MRLLITASLATVGIAAGTACCELPMASSFFSNPAEQPLPDKAESRDSTEPRIFANGVVEGKGRTRELRFEIPGRLASVEVQPGDHVDCGEVLAQLGAELHLQELEKARANLQLARARRERIVNGAREETRDVARAEAQITEARSKHAAMKFERTSKLREGNAASQQNLEDDRWAFEAAQAELLASRARVAELEAPARADDLRIADAQVSVAEAEVAHIEAMLEKTRLTAPCSGLVLDVGYEVGELVTATSGAALITMTDNSETRIRAFVNEMDAAFVQDGMPAQVFVEGAPRNALAATVVHCLPVMSPKRELRHRAGERTDVKVREVILRVEDSVRKEHLFIDLPVDVVFQRNRTSEEEDER